MFPCVSVLKPDMFVFQPTQVMMDFKQGAIMAFAEEFPGIVVKGCHFHFTQSIWRKIQDWTGHHL